MVELSPFSPRLKLRRFRRVLATVLMAAMTTAFWLPLANGDTLYDGYSKVFLDGQHVGFVALRYDFDNKKQEFTSSYYVKTDKRGGNVTESLKARATANLKPISFQYTELAGDSTKTIDASFKNDTMTAKVMENGKPPQVITKKIPKGVFSAIFLAYVMLQGKEGIKKGVKYNYQAIAEEDAGIYPGEAYISGEETILGVSAFKVLNTFKGAQFISYYTYKGEVVATRSPAQKSSTDLVASPSSATEGQTINVKELTQVFGAVPRGLDNPLSRRSSAPTSSSQPTEAPQSPPTQAVVPTATAVPPQTLPAKAEPSAAAPAVQSVPIKAPATGGSSSPPSQPGQ